MMDKAQAARAWEAVMAVGATRPILETLAGRALPEWIRDGEQAGPDQYDTNGRPMFTYHGDSTRELAVDFLYEWAAAMGGQPHGVALPVTGTVGTYRAEPEPPTPVVNHYTDHTVDGCPADKVGRLPLWLNRQLDDRDVMSTKELAWHLGIAHGTVASMARKGQFPASMVRVLGRGNGSKVRLCFYRDAARRYLLEHQSETRQGGTP